MASFELLSDLRIGKTLVVHGVSEDSTEAAVSENEEWQSLPRRVSTFYSVSIDDMKKSVFSGSWVRI